MREFKNGKFYYISSDEIVDECFIDCLSELMTVIGKEVTVTINLTEEGKFVNTVGKFWTGIDNQERTINQKYLMSDKSDDYLFFVEVKGQNEIGSVKILKATMNYFD